MGSPPSAHRPQLVRRLAPVPALGGSGPCWKATDGEVPLIGSRLFCLRVEPSLDLIKVAKMYQAVLIPYDKADRHCAVARSLCRFRECPPSFTSAHVQCIKIHNQFLLSLSSTSRIDQSADGLAPAGNLHVEIIGSAQA